MFEQLKKAIQSGDDAGIRKLIFEVNDQGYNLWHLGAATGSLDILAMMRPYVADLNNPSANDMKISALWLAANQGQIEAVRTLAAWGANINSLDANGDSILHNALNSNNFNRAIELIKLGADINVTNSRGFSAWHVAGGVGAIDVLTFVKAQVSNIDVPSNNDLGITALWLAANKGHIETVKALIAFGANINCRDALHGQTILHNALVVRDMTRATELMKIGADIKVANNQGFTPWHMAALNGDRESLTALKPYVPDIDIPANEDGKNSALWWAANKGQLEIVKTLLEWGANINACHQVNKFSVLHQSIASKHEVVTLELIKAEADINQATAEGLNPFALACAHKLKAIALTIVEHQKFNPLIVDIKGFNSLLWSLEFKDSELAEKIIKLGGTDINYQDKDGKTALFWSVAYNLPQTVELLLGSGAEAIIASKQGFNPWHLAAMQGNIEILTLMRGQVPDLDIPSNNEIKASALWLAANQNQLETVKVLANWGANINYRDAVNGNTILHDALAVKDTARTIELLKLGVDISITNTYGFTVWHVAASEGDIEVITALKDQIADIDIVSSNDTKISALWLAANKGQVETVKTLAAFGANINSRDALSGQTILHNALLNGDIARAIEFIKLGVDLNIANSLGYSSWHAAAGDGNEELLTIMRSHVDDIDQASANDLKITALWVAANKGKIDIVRLLVKWGANINALSSCGQTVLHDAIVKKDINSAIELIKLGADIRIAESSEGFSTLHVLSGRGDSDIIKALSPYIPDIDILSNNAIKITALWLAASKGYLETVKTLVALNANINSRDAVYGFTVLQQSITDKHEDISLELIKLDADINAVSSQGLSTFALASCHKSKVTAMVIAQHPKFNPAGVDGIKGFSSLHWSLELKDVEVVAQLLLAGGINIDYKDNSGRTALSWCASHNLADIAELLLSKNATTNIIDYANGFNPIHHAALANSVETLQVLLSHNPDLICAIDARGNTPWHLAAKKGHNDVLTLLKDVVPSVDLLIKDTNFSALHLATQEGKLDSVEWLLNNGASINLTNSLHKSALSIAVSNENIPMVRKLLENGADINTVDANGDTPLHIALNNMPMITILLEYKPDFTIRNLVDKSFLELFAAIENVEQNVDIIDVIRTILVPPEEYVNEVIILDMLNGVIGNANLEGFDLDVLGLDLSGGINLNYI